MRVASEPPSQADVERIGRLDYRAAVAHDRVVELYGDVGIRPVRSADNPRIAIELRRPYVTGGHSKLRVEVLVPDEGADLAESGVRDRSISSLAVETTKNPGDVGVHTDANGECIVQTAGVVDPHLR